MNKLTILTLSALLLTTSLSANEKTNAEKTDSVLAILPQLRGTEKLDALYTLIRLADDEIASKPYVDMLLDESRRQKDIEMETFALLNLIIYHFFQLDSDSIFMIADEAIPFLRQHKQYVHLQHTVHNVIVRHAGTGRFITALRMAEDLYEELKEIQDEGLMALMIQTIAGLYDDMDQHEEALRMYKESIEIAKGNVMGDQFYLQNYPMMVMLSVNLKHYEDALLYADLLEKEIDHLQQNNPDLNLLKDQFWVDILRVEIYAKMNRHDDALQALRRLEAMYKPEWDGTWSEMVLKVAYYDYYNGIGNYKKALEYLNMTAEYVENQTELDNVWPEFKLQKARLLFNMGSYRQAAEMAFQVIERRDERNTQRSQIQLNELRTIYELDKAELETVRQQAKVRRHRLINTGLALACVALLLIAGLTVYSRRKIAEKNRALYRQIKEHDRVMDELQRVVETGRAPSPPDRHYETGHAPSLQGQPNGDDDKQRNLVATLRDHLLNDQSLDKPDTDKLAEHLGTNRTYLFEAVKTITGKTLSDYQNDIRLEKAKHLLDTTDELIATIAMESGYGTARTLQRAFKERYGMSPSVYRGLAVR
ncbi:MAG: helix-turn-helix domain-containing protein [Bacteroidales bacterium]|nr:helix-turn-helix domain-containing protein [Bacteroidales bacterium]